VPDAVASAVCRCRVPVPCAGCCSECRVPDAVVAGDGVPFVDGVLFVAGVLLVASGDMAS
jgi:hypothetical protein